MGKLVGLLSSGIDLAMGAALEYHSSKKGLGKRTNSHYQQDLTHETQEIYHDEEQARREAKAFKELQHYADFQRELSNQVQDEIRCENCALIDSRLLGQNVCGDYFTHQPYVHPSLEAPSPRNLPYPVIIPQRRPEDMSHGWVRAYAPALMDCGIDQYTFLNFLDAFNKSSRSSPYLDAVSVAGLGVGFAPGITPMIISMAVPVAVKMAKTSQTEKNRANQELFAPNGLFAMVMTYKPVTSQAYPSHSLQPPQTSPWQSGTSLPYNDAQLPTSAALIFPESEPTGSAGQQNKFRQIGHFVADYGDRRVQARYVIEHPESPFATPPPTFRSRWDKPNHSANSRGLLSFVSAKSRDTEERREESRIERHKRPGKEDRGLLRELKGMVMKKDVLYLLITNAPSSPPSINNTRLCTPNEQSYRPAKRIKSPPNVLEPRPFQQPWMPGSGSSWEQYAGPPPAYESPAEDGEVCIRGECVLRPYTVTMDGVEMQ